MTYTKSIDLSPSLVRGPILLYIKVDLDCEDTNQGLKHWKFKQDKVPKNILILVLYSPHEYSPNRFGWARACIFILS